MHQALWPGDWTLSNPTCLRRHRWSRKVGRAPEPPGLSLDTGGSLEYAGQKESMCVPRTCRRPSPHPGACESEHQRGTVLAHSLSNHQAPLKVLERSKEQER